MVNHLLRHRTEQEAGEASVAATTDHDHVSRSSLLDQSGGWLTFYSLAVASDLRLEFGHAGQGGSHDAFRVLAQASDSLQWIRSHRFDCDGYLPGTDDEQASPAQRGLLGSEGKSGFGVLRTVDSDYDGIHDTSILPAVPHPGTTHSYWRRRW
jgi:hypothetical protein